MKDFLLRLINVPFGKTLIGFVTFQFVFLFFAKFPTLKELELIKNFAFPLGTEYTLTAFFIVCVHLLVAFNTLIFLVDSLDLHLHISKLQKDKMLDAKIKYSRFYAGLIFSVFISGTLTVLIIICNSMAFRPDSWTSIMVINEVASICLFSVFLYADICCLQVCKIIMDDNNLDADTKKEAKRFQISVKNYVYACDGPGLFGLILITILSTILHSELAGYYWQGFVVGAIGLHMAFSQSALAFISAAEE